jgi:hypothetical protein
MVKFPRQIGKKLQGKYQKKKQAQFCIAFRMGITNFRQAQMPIKCPGHSQQ